MYATTFVIHAPTAYHYYLNHSSNLYSVNGTADVVRWITEVLPHAIEYQGFLILTESEFMMLVLKFGPGERKV